MASISEYLKETKGEMKNVSWPSREQVISYTAVVIALCVFSAIVLGLFDAGFAYLLDKFILN